VFGMLALLTIRYRSNYKASDFVYISKSITEQNLVAIKTRFRTC